MVALCAARVRAVAVGALRAGAALHLDPLRYDGGGRLSGNRGGAVGAAGGPQGAQRQPPATSAFGRCLPHACAYRVACRGRSRRATKSGGEVSVREGSGGVWGRAPVSVLCSKMILLPGASSAPNSPLVARSSGIQGFRKQRTVSGAGSGCHASTLKTGPTRTACPARSRAGQAAVPPLGPLALPWVTPPQGLGRLPPHRRDTLPGARRPGALPPSRVLPLSPG
ncbi:hypothetical protein HNR07_000427 [Nocardiopsis metallicus]|uniref:Uncharacterized protein n=1 Tax=Nocardiopsis metallicus TaxID=179819 RepID=A0A840VXW6_9ACTN|nr:hypothetical protein [Nocardiopsis metallicus]